MRSFPRRGSVALPLVLTAFLTSCGGSSVNDPPAVACSRALPSFEPALSAQEVAVVQQSFPQFRPELFASGVVASTLTPDNFCPALFLGDARPQGLRATAQGVMLETNGFDEPTQPEFLPSQGTYFDRHQNAFIFELGTVVLDPLKDLESRMQGGPPLGGPPILVELRQARVDPAEVDMILWKVRDAVAVQLPQAANVDPRLAEVVIEPSIFYVRGSNVGDTWGGGLTEPLGNGRYRLHAVVFYIDGQHTVADWREFLVSEAINFYVLSLGRTDLAR